MSRLESSGVRTIRTRMLQCLVGAGVLAGCAAPVPGNGTVTPLMERDFGSACARQGHVPGSAAYRACILAYPATESADERAKRTREPM